MRLFFVSWGVLYPEFGEIVRDLKKEDHDILCWVRNSEHYEIKQEDFPETIFHENSDSSIAMPAKGVDTSKFAPLSEDLVHRLAPAERVFFSIMDKNEAGLSTEEKRQLFFDLATYWNGLIGQKKPDAIVFNTIPHYTFTWVVYSLAKLHGIKTIMFYETFVSDRIIVMNEFEKGIIGMPEAVKSNEKDYSLDEVAEDIRNFYTKQAENKIESKPYEVILNETSFAGGSLKRRMEMIVSASKRGVLLKKIKGYIAKKKINLQKEYEKLQLKPDMGQKYIYVPLQFQPECTTSVQGGVFNNQLLMIEILSKSLPEGWKLYVKEHPSQWQYQGVDFFGYRPRDFYKRIVDMKNTVLVPISITGAELIRNCQCIATTTGTSGLEALFRQKPVLAFGYPWYSDCEGVFKVRNYETSKDIIQKIASGYKVDKQKVINYLGVFDKMTFHGFRSEDGKLNSQLSHETNKSNYLKALKKELDRGLG